ncbi:V-type ATP synthase subunit D [Nodosilinea nodulosa]|uniref:V-type ATP synthase subunit D n=1 Tax=Nodosilinea nodulosa TaxID=416001 RepID=UPI000316A598|nr:V-type ATP synthase subunit D [Nodosilinea nodulosa]
MAKIAFNKGALKAQKDQIDVYERFLPSLDLKKTQLLIEVNRAEQMLRAAKEQTATDQGRVQSWVALLSATPLELSRLVTLVGWEKRHESVAGVRVPVLGDIQFQVRPYTRLGSPLWIDALVESLQEAASQQLKVTILEERVQLMSQALKKVTQRINLFEKVLIPEAKENIRKIRLFISDSERTAVCRSKLAKAKLEKAFLNSQAAASADPSDAYAEAEAQP